MQDSKRLREELERQISETALERAKLQEVERCKAELEKNLEEEKQAKEDEAKVRNAVAM